MGAMETLQLEVETRLKEPVDQLKRQGEAINDVRVSQGEIGAKVDGWSWWTKAIVVAVFLSGGMTATAVTWGWFQLGRNTEAIETASEALTAHANAIEGNTKATDAAVARLLTVEQSLSETAKQLAAATQSIQAMAGTLDENSRQVSHLAALALKYEKSATMSVRRTFGAADIGEGNYAPITLPINLSREIGKGEIVEASASLSDISGAGADDPESSGITENVSIRANAATESLVLVEIHHDGTLAKFISGGGRFTLDIVVEYTPSSSAKQNNESGGSEGDSQN